MNNISLIIISKNEEKNIQENISWVNKCSSINEIVVVDEYSSDSTIDQLKKLRNKNRSVKIFKKHLNNNFSKQRNFAVSKCNNDWILSVDCDEKLSDDAINNIQTLDEQSKNIVYSIKRIDIFLGKKLNHGETGKKFFIRLFRKQSGKFIGAVHEEWKTKKTIACIPGEIYHTSHKNLSSFLKKINFYTNIRALELKKHHQKTNLFQIIFYPLGKFFVNYFIKLGFLDSTEGIIMALCMSLHSFLTRAKLWHISQK